MVTQKVGMKQMQRQYFDAVNWAMVELIKGKTGIVKGKCLELNAGGSCLGMTLAEQTLLDLYLLVGSNETLQQMTRYIGEQQLEQRMRVMQGSNLKIPLADQTVDLVVSKSSIFLWQNRAATFREIYRVLAPGGVACLCGGFEPGDLQHRIDAKLEACRPVLKRQLYSRNWQQGMLELDTVLRGAEIDSYEMNYSDNGLWLLVRKPPKPSSANNAVATNRY
jgi:ubiquinone/menaquinone biosynthesis C-methylase UbiE